MALFNTKKKTASATPPTAPTVAHDRPAYTPARHERTSNDILIAPRVTEKAARASENNVYVFNVYRDATKNEIAKAIKELYKVTPERVNIVAIPARRTFYRGRLGKTSVGKKAYVYLKKGDSITLV